MKILRVIAKQGRVETEQAEVLVLTHFEGDTAFRDDASAVDRALDGRLRDLLRSGEFEGKPNETVLFHTQGKAAAKRVLLVGLGKKKDLRLDTIRQAFGCAAKRVRQAKATAFTAALPQVSLPRTSAIEVAQAMVEGAVLGSYQFSAYRSENRAEAKNLARMTVVTSRPEELDDLKEGVRRGVATSEAAVFVRDLCNHPSNVMTPSRIAQEAKTIAREHGVKLKVLERVDMEKLGMGALLGVARGSHEPPKFIILDYRGTGTEGRHAKPIVFVGKTITFDTGGISLKPAENMEQMKADMTGGAEVLATVRAAARLRLPIHVIGILPATENMPGGGAMKPGDIVKTLSGQTVEVQNTDAEGRLILADGLAYATRYKPAAVIDVATLTGACMVALGQFAIGMFGNDETLKESMRKAGLKTGERVWEMPLWEEYFEQLKSDVADMRNIGGRGGGMITAALFLSKFVGDYPWVHLDIASTDWSERERAYIPKGPTGIGTRLLIQYLIDRTL
ncbi:MAG TPA: leucyl aminopeptidase [Chloroflexota bacterium]|jgi:leucyl aminopeptidase|nr:leucyl aminopeptidase [Chloroflexota bacterium]